ncbi:hypothetical protein OXPF_06050 [Oxobacter pfennigii]|uniref:Phage-related minor tail protein n=1 Tax=Oxobacter pfennigii TaxID=36849 RepID=A0A0N8NTU6_9CLOT|nr:hypothetical protein [Oxobacter pfennigii]KPU45816.1 hypothetical protein OXPF_06050 [Oxobacter pfennigii]
MATISSALKLFDGMSGPLKSITQGMNLMISAMNQMQNTSKKNKNISKTLTAAKAQIVSAEAGIKQAIEESEEAQKEFNKSVKDGSKNAGGFMNKLKSMALIINTAKKLAETTIGGAMQQQQRIDMFSAQSGSKAAGTDIYNRIAKQALEYGQDVNKSLDSTMSFMSNTKDPAQLTQLSKLAMRLSKLNPAEGLEGAASSMKELMSGDYTSIAEKFNISKSVLQGSSAAKAGASGDVEGFITGMDELLNKQHMTEEAFNNLLDSPVAKWEKAINTFGFRFADAGRSAMNELVPLFDMINDALESGKFQPIFDTLSNGLVIAVNAAYGLAIGFMWIWDVIQQNWGTIEPILATVGGALTMWAVTQIPALISKLWGIVKPIAAAALNFFALNWPILLIGAIIGFLIYSMIKWGNVVMDVVGVIGGVFGVLFAYLFNRFAYFANMVLSIAEFFMNVWQDPVYAIKKLFYDLVINILQYLQNLAIGIENIINKIPGINIDITSGMDNLLKTLNDVRDDLKSEKDVITLMRIDQIDYVDAFNKGQDIGKSIGKWAVDGVQSAADALNSIFNPAIPPFKEQVDVLPPGGIFNPDDVAVPNINKVNEVGKINDTVDISSEDLKIMRELAEMKNIQNFVTLTPTVSVQTGDIREEANIKNIVTEIVDVLNQEIVSSASAVYS